MANGNLQDFLLTIENRNRSLSWEERLQIALDAAQGLEYLDIGCSPPIVHRGVKSSNILLTDKLRAKFGDFGISKTYPDDKCTHVTTRVMGTPGYMDPEFVVTQQLYEKSDVFAFGVVLFELITGKKEIIDEDGVTNHIINWDMENARKYQGHQTAYPVINSFTPALSLNISTMCPKAR